MDDRQLKVESYLKQLTFHIKSKKRSQKKLIKKKPKTKWNLVREFVNFGKPR